MSETIRLAGNFLERYSLVDCTVHRLKGNTFFTKQNIVVALIYGDLKRFSVMSSEEHKPTVLFPAINADDDDQAVTEIESLCFNCQNQGVTRLLLTKIPFFKEVIVSSFSCDHCGFSNSELQPAGMIQEKGVKYNLKVTCPADLNRQLVQTNYASVAIPEVELESPPSKGAYSTVEGVIQRTIDGLSQDQIVRRIQHPEVAEQIDRFIEKLEELRNVNKPFHLIIDDPSGNSFIENPHMPKDDPQLTVHHYIRNKAQNEVVGIMQDEEEEVQPAEPVFNAKDEVLSFPANCPACNAPCPTNMKLVDIPHFKEVVIMATSCDMCGHRESEVKGGSGIEPKGKKITLKITDVCDLSRDVLKSEMCCIQIPELDFSTHMSSMPGKFTTVEGLLTDIEYHMQTTNPFIMGDSTREENVNNIKAFCKKLEEIRNGERLGVHLILDDCTGNCYIQNLYAPDPDPEMTVELYERTFEQNDELGLNEMKTENYETDDS